ncbi:MAG: hypothetical protein U0641_14695 [Anaerolineae bacterium]
MRSLGASGMRAVAENAVLNANYIRVHLNDVYDLPFDRVCKHEVVFTGRRQGENVFANVLKRLLNWHPPADGLLPARRRR